MISIIPSLKVKEFFGVNCHCQFWQNHKSLTRINIYKNLTAVRNMRARKGTPQSGHGWGQGSLAAFKLPASEY